MDKSQIEIPPKDEEELELERLVFGDFESFEANLKNVDNLLQYSEEEYTDESASESDEASDNDEDMFFIDEGDDAMEVDGATGESDLDSEDESSDSEAAWSDSEDERVNISLKASDKLKKLRKNTRR